VTLDEPMAKQQITGLLSTCARDTDRLDDDGVRSVWYEGGTVQYLDRPVQPADECLAFSTPRRRRLAGHTQVGTNGRALARVRQDTARPVCRRAGVSASHGTGAENRTSARCRSEPPGDGCWQEH